MAALQSNEYANFRDTRQSGSAVADFPLQMNDLACRALFLHHASFIFDRNIRMPRAQYFVTRRKGEWKIRAGYRYSGPYPTKAEALKAAIDFAERDGQAGREAQVLVQGEDRFFRPTWTYGRDPYPIATRDSADSKPVTGPPATSA